MYAVTAPMQGLSFFQGEEGQSRFRGVAEKLPPDEVGHLITCESSSSSPCSTLVVEGDHAASLGQQQGIVNLIFSLHEFSPLQPISRSQSDMVLPLMLRTW